MTKKRQIAERQIRLQDEIQKAGFNIVTCGNCGCVLIHEIGDTEIECLCGVEMSLSECPDLWYEGVQNNEEFND